MRNNLIITLFFSAHDKGIISVPMITNLRIFSIQTVEQCRIILQDIVLIINQMKRELNLPNTKEKSIRNEHNYFNWYAELLSYTAVKVQEKCLILLNYSMATQLSLSFSQEENRKKNYSIFQYIDKRKLKQSLKVGKCVTSLCLVQNNKFHLSF